MIFIIKGLVMINHFNLNLTEQGGFFMKKYLLVFLSGLLCVNLYADEDRYVRPANYQHMVWHRVQFFGHTALASESGKISGVTTSFFNYNQPEKGAKITAMGGGCNYLAVATTSDNIYASYDLRNWSKLGNALDEDVTVISNGTMIGSPIYLGTETGKIYTFNRDTKQWKKLGFFRSPITAMEYDENGHILYFGEQNGKTFVYNPNGVNKKFQQLSGMDDAGKIMSIAVSPNSRYVVASTGSGKIYMKKPEDAGWTNLDKIHNEIVTTLVRDTYPGQTDWVYAGTQSGHVYQRDIVHGSKWTDVGAPGGNIRIVGMASPNTAILLTVMNAEQKVYEYNSYYKSWQYMGQAQ
jgi:hypothetical protein